jgi:hypothetical protein
MAAPPGHGAVNLFTRRVKRLGTAYVTSPNYRLRLLSSEKDCGLE